MPASTSSGKLSVGVISLEPWDEVWRRNQHLVRELLDQGLVNKVVFVEPATSARSAVRTSLPGVTVVRPQRLLPKRLAGQRAVGWRLRARWLRDVDVLWINDPEVGVAATRRGQPCLYDVTDDWRTVPSLRTARIVRAENRLARRCTTIVCSDVLQQRWQTRYGLVPTVVRNGVDGRIWADANPRPLPGEAPHIGYVGTLHQERLDVGLLVELAAHPSVGTVHLVGPVSMDQSSRTTLARQAKVHMHGPVPAGEVPSWTKSFDVLISPHRVTDFTLSLDAIKSYEYLASLRPVVATPTSGFQSLSAPQLRVVPREDFTEAVCQVLASPASFPAGLTPTWASRAREFFAAWPI